MLTRRTACRQSWVGEGAPSTRSAGASAPRAASLPESSAGSAIAVCQPPWRMLRPFDPGQLGPRGINGESTTGGRGLNASDPAACTVPG